jgi:hypothetical protein
MVAMGHKLSNFPRRKDYLMAPKKITAKTGKVEGRIFEGTIDLHDESLSTMSQAFGEDVVKSAAIADMVIAAQSLIRSAIEKGKSDAEIQSILNAWKPGVKTSLGPADPVESVLKKFNAMTPEEQSNFQKELMARLKAAKAA